MGWTVLYIAFGLVALWLLGEVLLQYKARLRWRLLAFAGFVGVVLGVLIPSVYVIGAGAIAFAIGQTYVTLSFRRGFSTGWAIGGNPGESRRRRGVVEQDPTLEVSDLEYEAEYREDGREGRDGRDSGYDDRDQGYAGDGYAPQQASVYAPEPLPDDTGSYGIYDTGSHAYPQQPAAAAAAADSSSYGYDTYNNGYDQQNYGYDQQGQQSYAAYSDPYIGTQSYDTGQYDTYGGGQQGYDSGQYAQYQQGGYGDSTPPGGVWVPQQRNGDETLAGGLPPEQPAYPPYNPEGYDTGYNEQQPYRY
ncbi:DUF998 domain-containing protein [Streptomyces sp. YC504]|uniref:DUF998 domain-containing protein n=1 Tax=Streptomyces mesophilus TaxID=1775132 RepID=A0A6G4XKS7_9ACTN|nr:DUF998 domain-containing protein [Streptomyces mesophilus]NGO77823.1 DUF998 domain-containing protein [Streptomyces mesophilus]